MITAVIRTSRKKEEDSIRNLVLRRAFEKSPEDEIFIKVGSTPVNGSIFTSPPQIKPVDDHEFDFQLHFIQEASTASHIIVPITTLINFNYDLVKPIMVDIWYEEGEYIGAIGKLDIYAYGDTEFEVLREINEDLTELADEISKLSPDQLGKKPRQWKKVLDKHLVA